MARLGALSVIVMVLCLAAASAAERRVALVIGNGAYTGTGSLANTVNDAAAIGGSLEKLGFAVTIASDVDRRSAIAAIDSFSRELEGADVAFLFYAGHGMQIAGENFLLPVDVDVSSERALRYSAIDIGEVVSDMERKARVALVVLDACRDNPFLRELARTQKETRSAEALPGLSLMQLSGRGAIIAYAAAAGEVASDGAGRHSPYTEALIEEIDEQGVEVGLMFRRAAGRVFDATQGKRPELLVRLVDEVYLNPAPPIAVAEAVPAALAQAEMPAAAVVVAKAALADAPVALQRSARAEGFFGTKIIHKPDWAETVTLPAAIDWQPAPAAALGEIAGNKSFAAAAEIPLAGSADLRIAPAGTAAWYKIIVPVAGELKVTAPTPPANLDLFARVWNADRAVVADWQGAARPGGELAGVYALPEPGTYWIEITDNYNDAESPMAFRIDFGFAPASDQLEANNSPGTARPIPLPSEFRPAIFPRNDADWYRIWAAEPGKLSVLASSVPDNLDIAMRLWNLDGGVVRDWVVPARPGGDTLLEAEIPAPGVYMIEMADSYNDQASTQTFPLSVKFEGVGDEAEPNDNFGAAALRESTSSKRIAIFPRGDADWFSLDVDHPGELKLDVTGSPHELDVHVRVWNANKDVLQDWVGPMRKGGDVAMTADLPRPGRYFVEVVDGSNDASSLQLFEHRLTFTPQPDQYEPNNSIAEAAPLTAGGEILFNILPRGDADWFRIEAPSQGELAVFVDDGPKNLDLYYRVWNLDRQLVRDWVAPYAKGGLTEGFADLPAAGPYFIEVTDGSNDERSIEHATLRTVFTPTPDALEPNNSFGKAKLVAAGSTDLTSYILPKGDADWYEVAAPQPGSVTVLVEEVDPALDIYVRLWNGEGAASSWIGPPRPGGVTDANFPVDAAGTYRIELTDGNNDARSPKPFKVKIGFK
jgi:uncharacterized caspase-like protein